MGFMGLAIFFVGIIMLAVMIGICFGWLIPLLIGIVKWSRKTGGKGWFIASGVWGLCALTFVGFCIYSFMTLSRHSGIEAFDVTTYPGDKATVILPYSGSGTLSIRQVDSNKSWRVSFSNTNGVMVPAGLLKIWYLSYQSKDQDGAVTGGMNCSFASREDIVVQAGEVITLQGGAPFTAMLSVEQREEGKLNIGYSLTDVAGNRITLWGGSEESGNPKFEAISPDGACFWSGELEYG
jgi:energy-coupling factor transporter transmembrane protein EcfT